MSVYAFEKKFDRGKDFCMAPKNRKFSTFSRFRRMSLEASIEYLGSFRSVPDVFLFSVIRIFELEKRVRKSRFFDVRMADFGDFQPVFNGI